MSWEGVAGGGRGGLLVLRGGVPCQPCPPSSLLLPLGGEWGAAYLEVIAPLQISRREHGGEGFQLDKGAGRLPWLIRPTPPTPPVSIYLFYYILVDPFAAVI